MHSGNSPGAHQPYASGCSNNNNNNKGPPHHSHVASVSGTGGHHRPVPRMPTSQRMYEQQISSAGLGSSSGGRVNGKPHLLSNSSPGPYGSSPGPATCSGRAAYFMDISPGYYGDCDDDRTPPTPMWPASISISPPSARSGGMLRSSPPLRGMSGNGLLNTIPNGMIGCHGAGVHPGGPGGLGYKSDRARQSSFDEGRLGGGVMPSGGGGGTRSMRCNSDSAQVLVSPGCGSGHGGDEFSLDLKKVGVEKDDGRYTCVCVCD